MKLLSKGIEVYSLDLGMVEIGTSKEYNYVLENDSKWECIDIEVIFTTINDDSKVIELSEIKELSYPKTLNPYETGTLSFVWEPSIEIKSGIKANFKIKCNEVWS